MELVDSVDDLRSSSSTRRIRMPDFEVLDARIASTLNKIIQNTRFKNEVSLEETKAHKDDRFLRGRQIAYLTARRDEVPKAGQEQGGGGLANSRTCVCATTFAIGMAHAGGEG